MNRRNGIITLGALSTLLLCGSNAPVACNEQIGPSSGEVIGAAVGIAAVIAVGTVVLVDVHQSHHTIKGCVTSGPNGLEVLNDKDKKTYTLTGVTANVKVGDVIQVHGSKEKKDSAGNRDFVVEKLGRDYGQCKVESASAPAAAGTAGAP
ncbi:MAG: hypothetical protein WBE76_00250 [Terracidiphilus sp.]